MLRVLLWIVAVIVILILICFVYHRYRLNAEKKLREPLGQLVDINGNNMSIYVEGSVTTIATSSTPKRTMFHCNVFPYSGF